MAAVKPQNGERTHPRIIKSIPGETSLTCRRVPGPLAFQRATSGSGLGTRLTCTCMYPYKKANVPMYMRMCAYQRIDTCIISGCKINGHLGAIGT